MGLQALAETIADDRRFPEAAHAISVGVLAVHERSPASARLLSDRGQHHVISICHGLHPRITAAEVCRRLQPGTASRNRVANYLASLVKSGVLVPAADPGDRRTRALAIAPSLLEWLDAWALAIVSPALPWVVGPAPDLADSGSRSRWYRQFVEAHARGLEMLAGAPLIARGLSLVGGGILLLELMRHHHRPPPPGAPRFSRRAFAERYGLTRTHLIDLLAEFEGRGFIEVRPSGPVPTAALAAQGVLWQSMHLAVAARTLENRLHEALDSDGYPPLARQALPALAA